MADVTQPRPLSKDDDRRHFECGRDSEPAWFQRHAWHNQATGISRTNVICATSTGLIVGYVTLSAAQIEREYLAKAVGAISPTCYRQRCSANSRSTRPIRARVMHARSCFSH